MRYSLLQKCLAEFFGTMWLVLGGCGSAVISAAFPQVGIGLLGVSLAFGLTVLGMAYAIGGISGGHFNPAVTVGCVVAKRHPTKELLPYVFFQVLGAVLGAAVLYCVASGKAGFSLSDGFAANGYGDHSPGGYTLGSAFVVETVLTALFLFIILGSTHPGAEKGFAPISIALTLTLIHLISIPVTNTSVNPARSLSQAVFVGGWALEQVWLFWVAPILGAILGAKGFCILTRRKSD